MFPLSHSFIYCSLSFTFWHAFLSHFRFAVLFSLILFDTFSSVCPDCSKADTLTGHGIYFFRFQTDLTDHELTSKSSESFPLSCHAHQSNVTHSNFLKDSVHWPISGIPCFKLNLLLAL